MVGCFTAGVRETSLPIPTKWINSFVSTVLTLSSTTTVRKNKYGSVQELRSTFRQFYFVLVMFQLGSEWKGLAWLLVEFCLVNFGLYCWVWFGFGFGLVELGLVSLSLIYTSQDSFGLVLYSLVCLRFSKSCMSMTWMGHKKIKNSVWFLVWFGWVSLVWLVFFSLVKISFVWLCMKQCSYLNFYGHGHSNKNKKIINRVVYRVAEQLKTSKYFSLHE